MRRVSLPLLVLLSLAAFTPDLGFAQGEVEDDGGPMLFSVFPSTAQPGSTLQAEARGPRLDGAYAVWFDDDADFSGRILSVEEDKKAIKQRVNPLEKLKISGPFYRVLIELHIKPTTHAGVRLLRLVSSRGVSNPIGFTVADAPVAVETPNPHQIIEQSQPVDLPGFISGRLTEPGEVDYYSFFAKKGQALRFEMVEEQKFDATAVVGKFTPELALFREGGSWFDPHRALRVLFEEERSSDLMHINAAGTYQFVKDGQYFLGVTGLFGQGCADCTYQVQVSSREGPSGLMPRRERTNSDWVERSFSRALAANWMKQLEARSVRAAEAVAAKQAISVQANEVLPTAEPVSKQLNAPGDPLAVVEHKSTEPALAESISVPAVIEGTIEHPGEVDGFKFKIDPGQKMAFEVETSQTKPPYFNPRVGVVDSQDHELFSNVERRLSMFNNNADPQVYLKDVQPKATYSFERGGEYTLQVRDITSRYGDASYHYRILVRPQMPHVGEISVIARDSAPEGTPGALKPNEINRINLVRREAKKLILVASYEEGFTGDLSFFFTGLPDGVQAFPAVQFNEGRAPLEVIQNPDVIAPKQQKTALILLASPEAALTRQPKTVQLRCQPVANGKLGPDLLVREIPLMVVEGSTPKGTEKSQSVK